MDTTKKNITQCKRDDPNLARHLREALDANFSNCLTFEISERQPQEIYGTIDLAFASSAIFGEREIILVIGVKSTKEGFKIQNIHLERSLIESFIKNQLSELPVHQIQYGEQQATESVCYIVSFRHNGFPAFELKNFLAPLLVQPPLNPPRKPRATYERPFSQSAIEKYKERRKSIKPDAIELKFPNEEIPSLLGLENNYIGDAAAIAAFGDNRGVESVIYVRSGFGPEVSRRTITEWIDRTTETCARGLDSLTPVQNLDKTVFEKDIPSSRSVNKSRLSEIYRVGGDIFEVLENIQSTVSRPEEIFRAPLDIPEKFSQRHFAWILQELVCNAFAHGLWKSGEDSNRDDTRSWRYSNSVAICHLENRIEVINRQPRRRLRHGLGGYGGLSKYTSPLHLALKDIDLANGRRIGLKLARARIMKRGMASPIALDTTDTFRVVLPLTNEFTFWAMLKGNNKEQNDICDFFILKLCILLKEVDEEIVSNALGMRLELASERLARLSEANILQRKKEEGYGWLILPDHRRPPRYIASGDHSLSDALTELSTKLIFFPAPELMSPAGLYALSTHAMYNLVADDIRSSLWKIFYQEGVYHSKTSDLASAHFDIVAKHRALPLE